jgi:hypothetical protein
LAHVSGCWVREAGAESGRGCNGYQRVAAALWALIATASLLMLLRYLRDA